MSFHCVNESSDPRSAVLALVLSLCSLFFFPLSATAETGAPREFLLRTPPDSIEPGDGVGEFDNPRGMAADPLTGHLYVSDRNNSRISEFSAWGTFVKAWGWDVAPGAVDEEQEIVVRAGAGAFRLSFESWTTPDLPFNASAAEVQGALEALPPIDAVTVEGGPGGVNGGTPYVVRFGGSQAALNVPALVSSPGSVPLSGGEPLSGVRITTRADGTGGGTGLEACTAASDCKTGTSGAGVGQLSTPRGIAVDEEGDVYIFESQLGGENHRVQKFDRAGRFELMWGGEVNKTTGANVCTAADFEGGDECGSGLLGTADGWFSSNSVGNYLTYNPGTDTIFVGDVDRIQEFELDGTFKGAIDFEATLDGRTVEALAADPFSGDLYVALVSNPPTVEKVYRLDGATGAIVDELEAIYPGSITVDAEGNVYAALKRYTDSNVETIDTGAEILGFDAAGDPIEGMVRGDGFGGPLSASHFLMGVATNVLGPGSGASGNLYADYFQFGEVSYINAYGPAPIAFEDPPAAPPAIQTQFATSVDADSAIVKAKINPLFWTDATYFVQYGTVACPKAGWEGPACSQAPFAPALLTTSSTNVAVSTAGVMLAGLEPGATYHYRFVAQSSGGGPTFGAERTFRTFTLPPPEPCSNDEFRKGPGANLPDCRAYEMVSSLDKNGADVLARKSVPEYLTSLDQSASSGRRFTYSAATAFPYSESAPYTSQYLAERDSGGGWLSEPISPPRTRLLVFTEALDNEFRFFSADLCNAWLRTLYDPPLAEGAVEGIPNVYRRRNCDSGSGSFETLSAAMPADAGADVYEALQPLDASVDGSHAVFVAPDNLVGTEAPTNADNHLQLYLKSEAAGVSFVCILPAGDPSKQPCYAGTADEALGAETRAGSFQGAISADGSRIFWSEAVGTQKFGPGKLFVRFTAEPVSREVSGKVSKTDPARFWGAAEDGSRAIFAMTAGAKAGNLYSFDVDAETPTLIAEGSEGVMGIGSDARRVYFASTKVLTGEEENSEGDKAQEGAHNLYLWEEGDGGVVVEDYKFIARLPRGETPLPIAEFPVVRSSRVSSDGMHAAFMSTASLTGFDNTDAESGEPDAEVFLYDAADDELRCVSCNPGGARPMGGPHPAMGQSKSNIWYAAKIPTWTWPTYASRVLSEDGRRVFFESVEALAPRDTNGQQDVYQWEEAGKGGCDVDDATFSADAEGCIDLISSGESQRESVFLDASATGDDVFLSTLSSLLKKDYGLIDIYDARVGGGFPEPVAPVRCQGEACQSPPAPTQAPTPSSEQVQGQGNEPRAKPRPRRCPKGKRRVKRGGKTRCVPRRKAAKRRRAAR